VKRRNGAGSVLVTVGLAKSGLAGCWGWVECSAVEWVQANGRGMWRKERDEDGEESGPHPARGGCAWWVRVLGPESGFCATRLTFW
jgi:hypothetical protein